VIPFASVFLPLLIAYGGTLQWCVDRWNAPTQYFAHCWLVPLVGAWVVWHRRERWRGVPRAADRRGWWLLAPGLALHAAGASLMVDSWSAASLVLTVPGAAWLALGGARLRPLWPVLGLVLFVVPLPIYVEQGFAFGLKEIAVQTGTWLANVLGADVVRVSDRLVPRGTTGSLWVAPACGGLRSLLAMLTLAYCLAFFAGTPSWRRRLVLLAAAPLLAIAANSARIAALCLMARHFGVPFAEATGHDVANVVEWVALLATLVLLDRLLTRAPIDPPPEPAAAAPPAPAPSPPAAVSPAAAGSLRGAAIALWLAAVPLLAWSLYRPHAERTARAESLPATLAGYVEVPRGPEARARFERDLPQFRALLGTDDFVWRHYRGEDGAFVNVTAVFHDTNWKSVHPPRICIEGSNMTILADEVAPAPWLGDGLTVGRIVAAANGDGAHWVTLSVFGTRDWLSGDYWEFTWHHLPRALVRASVSGFLLRVESKVRGGGDHARAAEARCREVMAALVPAAREAMR
jgi:exosortase